MTTRLADPTPTAVRSRTRVDPTATNNVMQGEDVPEEANKVLRTRRCRTQAAARPSVRDFGGERAARHQSIRRTPNRPLSSRVSRPHRRKQATERPSSAATCFTPFVRRLADGHAASDKEIRSLLETLRGALVGALRRRRLWTAPPRFLGVIGHASWTNRYPSSERVLDDAIGELVADCYLYIFVQRLPRLIAQLAVKSNIDGLVFLNIQHFLHEKQRKHDPLGYRIHGVLRASLQSLIEDGHLRILEGPAPIKSRSIVGFQAHGKPVSPQRLAALTAPWANHLAQPMVQARPAALPAIGAQLGESILTLRRHGAEAFVVRDLLQILQRSIREHWASQSIDPGPSAFEHIDGLSVPISTVPPNHRLEDRSAFESLVSRVGGLIEDLDVKPQTRSYLQVLWAYLGAFADDRPDLLPPSHIPAPYATRGVDDDVLPSHRRLAAMLEIPRHRLSGLFSILCDLVAEIQTQHHDSPSVANPMVESA